MSNVCLNITYHCFHFGSSNLKILWILFSLPVRIMSQTLLGSVQKLVTRSVQNQSSLNRSIHATATCMKTQSGKYKITPKRDRPLTYEMSNQPNLIAHRKTWNSWNCSNLADGLRPSETAVEDIFIRKFVDGTFHGHVASEIIIKRQFNHIRIAFLLRRNIYPQKAYFLIGYTEELLANWLQCPITVEIQSIEKMEDTIFKYI